MENQARANGTCNGESSYAKTYKLHQLFEYSNPLLIEETLRILELRKIRRSET